MRLASFSVKGTTHVGVVDGTVVVSLGRASAGDPRFRTMLDLVLAGPAALADVRDLAESHPTDAAHDVEDVTLLAPLAVPPRVHGRPATVVAAGPGALVGPAADGDLVVGIGGVVGADPGARLFGATIVGGAQGPVLVTADELGPALGPAARLVVRVNGVIRSWTAVPGVLDQLERRLDVTRPHQPGALVVLDLPTSAEPDARALRDGDEVEIEVAGLGLLRNRIRL